MLGSMTDPVARLNADILPLFDSGEADGLLFCVMPFVEGETLRDRLEREKQLPVDEAVRIATDVAEALYAAHQHGVIPGDINMLVIGNDAFYDVTLDDERFLMAREIGEGGGTTSLVLVQNFLEELSGRLGAN
jgi:serine/threonine protein kinase